MKKCFKCNQEKPFDCFYKHKETSDGYLGKCKDCTYQDVRERTSKLRKDPEWVLKERERTKDKYHRLNYKDRYKGSNHPSNGSKFKNLSRKFKIPKGIELHHWSYNDEHIEDVFFLPRSFHSQLHATLVLDKDYLMFRDFDGNLLDTKDKHKNHMDKLRS